MKRIFWVYFALLILGLIVLAWPEQDDVMMISFSETHGPSKVDLAGILIIMMGYVPMIKEVWKHSPHIRQSLGKKNWNLLIAITIVASVMIAWSLYQGNDVMLWIAVFVATASQGVLVFMAYRKE